MTDTPKTMPYGEGQISYHEMGEGEPLLMLHGSGPGVTAWMNFGGNHLLLDDPQWVARSLAEWLLPVGSGALNTVY